MDRVARRLYHSKSRQQPLVAAEPSSSSLSEGDQVDVVMSNGTLRTYTKRKGKIFHIVWTER